jgi:hypothetical protein
MRPTTAHRLTPAHPAARLNSRKNKDKSERLVTCFVRVPGMCEARPRYQENQKLRCIRARVFMSRMSQIILRKINGRHWLPAAPRNMNATCRAKNYTDPQREKESPGACRGCKDQQESSAH